MGTKLDEWIGTKGTLTQLESIKFSFPTLYEAIQEYIASRQWPDGPPPKQCKCAYIQDSKGVVPAWRYDHVMWKDLERHTFINESDIIRHCPISPPPPLPKPKIPEGVAKHGDGWYRVGNMIAYVEGKYVDVYKVDSGCRLTDVAKDLTWKRIEQPKAGDA